ncbi:type II secretion system protein GspK [Brevundimonas sp. DC300-4]|uniref:type II secretion system protein GspK n=1 Tax=Brevundimonas sp. DC300-4 TaxID=2804594 RepID=UPI003CE779ED
MASDRSGFALPAVLAVTGVVTIIFLVAITALSSLNGEARSARERVRFLQSALTAEAAIQFMAATEPFGNAALMTGSPRRTAFSDDLYTVTPPGVEGAAVLLDGHRYEIEAAGPYAHPVFISLQDQGGMLNLAHMDGVQLERLGSFIGLPADVSRNLGPLYLDYVDADDLEEINGAERPRYDGGGPANRYLLRGSELLSLLGVREGSAAARWREVRDDIAVDHRRAVVNVNTASATTLEILFGISRQQAQSAVGARERSPFLSMTDFVAASGGIVPYDESQVLTFPAGRIVYSIADTQSAWRYRARLTLTPSSAERPFWANQTEMTEASGTAMASRDADRFPFTPR